MTAHETAQCIADIFLSAIKGLGAILVLLIWIGILLLIGFAVVG